MRSSRTFIIKIVVGFSGLLPIYGCANTNFSSSNGNKTSNTQKDTQVQSNADLEKDHNPRPETEKDPEKDETKEDSENTDTDIETEKIDDCLVKKADNYNINLIFDNSGSQMRIDPNLVRRDGAISFVDQFSKFVSRNKKSRVYISVLSFNTNSIRGNHAWVKLTGTNSDTVKNEIIKATDRPGGGTAYSPVLRDAASYFTELKKSVTSSKAKNYVIFLTDGLPNAAHGMGGPFFPGAGGGEKMEDIPKAIDVLVNDHDVAVIAIASGDGIPPDGEHITQSLAKPTVGKKDKNHLGIYKRARTTDDLNDVWKSLFASIGKCD
jgi:hypothetical protein